MNVMNQDLEEPELLAAVAAVRRAWREGKGKGGDKGKGKGKWS